MTRNFVQMDLLASLYQVSRRKLKKRLVYFLHKTRIKGFVLLHKTTANCAQSHHVHFFHSFWVL